LIYFFFRAAFVLNDFTECGVYILCHSSRVAANEEMRHFASIHFQISAAFSRTFRQKR